jgi:hypothetical protein
VPQTAQAIDRAFIDAFAERWHDAWNSHDPGRVAALCTADVVLQQSSSPTQHGRAGVEQSVRQLATAFGDFRFTPTEPTSPRCQWTVCCTTGEELRLDVGHACLRQGRSEVLAAPPPLGPPLRRPRR